MSKLLIPSVVAMAAMCASTAHAVDLDPLPDSFTISNIYAWSNTETIAHDSRSGLDGFGTYATVGAQTTIGNSSTGASFVYLSQASANTYSLTHTLDGELSYSWRIVGDATKPVLVHISTSGYLRGSLAHTDTGPGNNFFSANYIGAVVAANFNTSTLSNVDAIRSYGLQTGNRNYGVTTINATDIGNGRSVDASFAESFDLWVTPNATNTIQLLASIGISRETPGEPPLETREFYDIQAFIDPTITIDAAYAADYTLEQSYIPAANVPEPESYALFFAGLAVIGASTARRRGVRLS